MVIQGLIVLLASLISGVVLVGGLGRLALKLFKLEYSDEEGLIAVASFGIAALSVVSIILCAAGLYTPAALKVLFVVVLALNVPGFKVPSLKRPNLVIALLVIPSIAYVLISPVVEKDLSEMATIQHLIASGEYATNYLFLWRSFLVFSSASLAGVFAWIPAYNFLSGYGWIITAAMLYGVYLFSDRVFGRNAALAAVLLVTPFQIYSRTIDYRSSIVSLVFFLYIVYLTTKEPSKERKILCGVILINTAFTNPFGLILSACYLALLAVKKSVWVLAASAVIAAVLMNTALLEYLLEYGLFLVGLVGLVKLNILRPSGRSMTSRVDVISENSSATSMPQYVDSGIKGEDKASSFYTIAFLLLIAVALLKPYESTLLPVNSTFDVLKNVRIYLLPLALALTAASLLGSTLKEKAVYAALILILIPHQAWLYDSIARMHVPTRDEVHSYTPYPGGVTGSPFILPVQAAYMTLRYKDAVSTGLFPVSIYGTERNRILDYLFYRTDQEGYFTDLTPEDAFREFDAVIKYTGLSDAKLSEGQETMILAGDASLLQERNVSWIIAARNQKQNLTADKTLEEAYSTENYVILERT
ncbi:MAG: hypothetical protein NTU61_01400 [Candidatus Altiarchaeota archaeon]|nr:hypothetical protein [Candidatus Altiarchaeota archaeon]